MFMNGDFDIENRVSATEGEAITMGAIFGNYDEDVYGEVEAYDVLTMGDFDDSDTMGRFKKPKIKKPKFAPKRLVSMPKSVAQKLAVPKLSAPKVALPKPAAAIVSSIPKPAAPITSSVPRKLAPSVPSAFRKTVHGMRITAPKLVAPKISVPKLVAPQVSIPKISAPVVSVPKISTPSQVANVVRKAQKAYGRHKSAKSAMVRPAPAAAAAVVAPAGQPLTAASIPATTSTESIANQATAKAAAKVLAVKGGYAHPLLLVQSGGMGDVDVTMGFDLKSFISKATTDAKAALNKAVSDAQVKAKEAASNFLSTQSAKLVSDPKVQALAKQEAEKAATQKLAETLRSPETKAMAMNAGKVAIGLGALFIAWKMYKSRVA